MLKQVLKNRIWKNIDGGWYAPTEKIESFPSVTRAELMNTTSSAGDWDGLFVQKVGNVFYVIPFSQENQAWRGGGYNLSTGEVLAEGDRDFSVDELNSIYSELMEMLA